MKNIDKIHSFILNRRQDELDPYKGILRTFRKLKEFENSSLSLRGDFSINTYINHVQRKILFHKNDREWIIRNNKILEKNIYQIKLKLKNIHGR